MDLDARNLTDLQGYIDYLEANNLLIRVKTEVDAEFELAGIAKRFEGDKALLFEKVKGSDYPVLIGLYWNLDIMASVFDCQASELPFVLTNEIQAWGKDPVEPVILDKGPANEVIETDIDLYKLPIPHHATGDGGRYLTSSVVIAKDPDTGVRNLSIHRMMVTGPQRFTLLLEELGHVMDYYKRAEAKGVPLEITVNNGVEYRVSMAVVESATAASVVYNIWGNGSQISGWRGVLI